MKRILSVAFGFAIAVSIVYAGSKGIELQGREVIRDGDRVTVVDATVTTAANDRASADYASFIRSAARDIYGTLGVPYVVELRGGVELNIGGVELSADSARYYPELNAFSADRFRIPPITEKFTIGCSSSGNQVQVTFPNGTVITADSVCSGGSSYSCSNHQMSVSAESC